MWRGRGTRDGTRARHFSFTAAPPDPPINLSCQCYKEGQWSSRQTERQMGQVLASVMQKSWGARRRRLRSSKPGPATQLQFPAVPVPAVPRAAAPRAPSQPPHAAASTMLGASLSAPCSCHTLMDA